MNQYQEISRQFYQNRLLFGDPADAGIVALEIASPTEIEVFKRIGGKIVRSAGRSNFLSCSMISRICAASGPRSIRASSPGSSATAIS